MQHFFFVNFVFKSIISISFQYLFSEYIVHQSDFINFEAMATVELDPQFIKALRLLRSKSKDSGAQLRAMLDEAIR